ncbi:Dynein heavy chain 2, axonemal [Amphibalanus amphitrite]|uniref:Dynein heavy chain 2, axonemal n=1 Tax=Amphibalanus amphitrite TaxID=1232801 RepID=A0A6A4WI09_AMPAM|nr:Dynein heavy chain 2, axonemal [Amphibalanus amphitrite]
MCAWSLLLLLLLLTLPASLAVTRDRYTLQPNITFSGPAVRSVRAASVPHCARFCSALTSTFCDGFRYGGGQCELLASGHHCLLAGQRAAGELASYQRRTEGGVGPLCGPGWVPFDGSCYLRNTTPQTREAAEKLCAAENPCSALVSVSSRLELAFVMHHWSRPAVSEWTGARLVAGAWTNPDGTQMPDGTTVSGGAGTCLATFPDRRPDLLLLRLGPTEEVPAICEAVRPAAGPPSGCPPGWLQLDSACFTYRAEPLSHQAADEFCGSLQAGARLGHPARPGDQQILVAFVSQSAVGRFWVGLTDVVVENVWRSMDGSPNSFQWTPTRDPEKLNALENCLLLDSDTGWAYDKECFDHQSPPNRHLILPRYSEVANNVQMQDTIVGSQFTMLDSAGLKQSIVSHCTEWQLKLTQLLLRIASDRLTEVHRYVTDNTAGMKYEPQTLDELQTSINLHERLLREQPEQEASFPVMEEQFVVLEKYEVAVEDSVLDDLHRLPPVWEAYCALLVETTETLEAQKDRFRTGLLADANDLKKGITNLIDDFKQKGPFTNAWDVEAARANINEYRNQAALLKEKDQIIKTGLKIFNIEHPLSKDLKRFETDLDAIDSVWALTAEWEQSWIEWKGHRFQELDTIELDSQATSLHKRLTKQLKEYRDNGWDIIEQTKTQVDAFRKALPLIMDLKNVALRTRHWEEIRALIGREFNEDTDLTMDSIFEWGMNQYSEEIHNISQSATKEMTIEKMLMKMKSTWDEMEMEILPYKDGRGLRCRVPDDLFQVLEDNQVGLQTMKASRFVEPFREQVKWWEKTLTVVYEVIDAILSVQKQWMYMEV